MEKIRELTLQGLNRDEAIDRAISYCETKKILLDFLRDNASKVRNMLLTQFNMETAKKVWKEEATAKGLAKGIAIGVENVLSLWEKGYTLDEVKAKLSTHRTATTPI